MLADDILSRSAADIVVLYRSKRVSPVEVVTATLDRIDRLDRLYNAFVVIDREGALRDALASEERWRRGEPSGLLDGLPVTVKDLVLVKGMPTRRGSRTTSPVPSEEDGPPVARMRRHGAVFLGKTTTSEWAVGPVAVCGRPSSPSPTCRVVHSLLRRVRAVTIETPALEPKVLVKVAPDAERPNSHIHICGLSRCRIVSFTFLIPSGNRGTMPPPKVDYVEQRHGPRSPSPYISL